MSIKVRVKVGEHTIMIPCGSGTQNFQWLGSVIKERIQHFNILRKSLETDYFIVTEIKNSSGELINPKDKIYEHSGPSGLDVSATISSTFPVDDWENPLMNDWMQVSLYHSQTNLNWAREIDAWRVNLNKTSGSKTKDFNVLAPKVGGNNFRIIKIGFDFSDSDVELAFNLDWKGMSWDWLKPTDITKSKLGDLLKSNYSLICNVFCHYAGVGKVGQRFGISLEEFGHFLHFMKISDWKESEELIESIFFETTKENIISKSNSISIQKNDRYPLMTRAHFSEALVAVALKFELASNAEDALSKFFDDYISKFWDSITSTYFQYVCLDPELKTSFMDYYHLLRKVFDQRSSLDSKFGPRLSAEDFLNMAKSSTLIDSDQEIITLNSFLQAQLSPSRQYELEYIVFIEFIEALSRLANKAIESYSGMTDAKKIRMAFSLVVELLANDQNDKNDKK